MKRIGWPRRHFRLCDSTNTRARELASAGAPHGTIVTADQQSAGRGRQGRTWTAPPGKALLCTLIVRPLSAGHSLLPLSTAVAVSETVEALASVSARIKWPNDVVIPHPLRASAQRGSRDPHPWSKVAGILVEARPAEQWAVIGIGINVSIEPAELGEELREVATSIGGGATVEGTLELLTPRLDAWLDATPESVIRSCRERDALVGRGLSWAGGEGIAAGIDDAGSLLIDTDAGRIALSAGEVHLTVA